MLFRSLYDRCMVAARGPRARWSLFAVSLTECSFFPIQPDFMLAPMILADRANAWRLAAICLAGALIGGWLGYAIGYFFSDAIGRPIIDFYGYGQDLEEVTQSYRDHGGWIVFIGALTPIPYKLITLSSGFVALDLWTFTLWSLIGRGLRYFGIAALLFRFGESIRDFARTRMGRLAAAILIAVAILGFLSAKLLF